MFDGTTKTCLVPLRADCVPNLDIIIVSLTSPRILLSHILMSIMVNARSVIKPLVETNGNSATYGSIDSKKCLNGEKGDIHHSVDHDDDNNDEATFFRLVQRNRPFRLYLLSFVVTHTGEWLTYIASITVIENLLGSADATSRTAIGVLVLVRLIPNVLLMSVGGTLADSRDRRESMIFLDIVGAVVVLLFIVAFECKSLVGIYLVTFLQQCVAALYEPCRSSIIPLLVPQENYLKKATTLSSLAWSLMAAVGSSLGGIAVTSLGVRACFGTFKASQSTRQYGLLKDKAANLISASNPQSWIVSLIWRVHTSCGWWVVPGMLPLKQNQPR